jgi:hypothetical protein
LEATGYLEDGERAAGVSLGNTNQGIRRRGRFVPDASWRGSSSLTVYFKHVEEIPSNEQVEDWRKEIWNEGFAPLLWVVSPRRVDVYNGFGRPEKHKTADDYLLDTFETIESRLNELDNLAGRIAMETGQFWLQPKAKVVDRKTSVNQQLLDDLEALEQDLVKTRLDRSAAQALIGRSIFTQYLIDREIVNSEELNRYSGKQTLPDALRNPQAAEALFRWLGDVFNGDMFPVSGSVEQFGQHHLARMADFLEATDSEGQLNLFPYRFDIIPVELISSIYQQFVHSHERDRKDNPNAEPSEAKENSVHYTRLPVVSLILDEVMDGISGNEKVLDLTCGSGVFLVEALRRLVNLKAKNGPVTRELIRSTLYQQIYGVDKSDAAIRVAAFSLYLAAMELDPDPQPPEQLKFERLIGQTLIQGDARTIKVIPPRTTTGRDDSSISRFDLIVGNPPWNFKGKTGTEERRKLNTADVPQSPRGEAFDFAFRAMDFGHENTRYGLVLSAMPFFSRSQTGNLAAQHLVRCLSPVTLVNLSALRGWLFPSAQYPAIVLLARCRPQRTDQMTVVNVHWSLSGEKSHSFEISPSDITTLSLASWEKSSDRLKISVFGLGRDRHLLDDLRSRYESLDTWLNSIGTKWCDGFVLGKPEKRINDATELCGLEILKNGDISSFQLPKILTKFNGDKAERPRNRKTYYSPLLLVNEFLFENRFRPIVAVADRDLIYPSSIYGAALGSGNSESAYLVAAILSSALASWLFLMTAGEFGIKKQYLLNSDLGIFPIPSPNKIIQTEAGQKLLFLEKEFRTQGVKPEDWQKLDQAVFDLYELDEADRIVVNDGLERAGWEWKKGRNQSVAPASIENDLQPYALVFSKTIDGWLQATGKRSIRAEVFELPSTSPLRIVRFVIENQAGQPTLEIIKPQGELSEVLARIGNRLGVRLGSALVGQRELRVYGTNEIVIIKPAARRFWMRIMALEDADAVIAESFRGAEV